MAPTATDKLAPFAEARAITDGLFGELHDDAWFERPIPERNRIIFYLGHLEAFDWRQVATRGDGKPPIDERLDALFAFGIDPPPGQLPSDAPGDWPSLQETRSYVARVRSALEKLLPTASDTIVAMVTEHRLMHAETFGYMLHNLAYEKRRLQGDRLPASGPSPALRMIEIPEGTATLGRARSWEFGWDNEYDSHTQEVPGFAISEHKVTNGQYLEFVRKGGPVPHYWIEADQGWSYRAYSRSIPLPLDWPVYASETQARAFAEWSGRRLPSEAQFHRAAFGTPSGEERPFPWGHEGPDPIRGNFGFRRRDPVAVTATPAGNSAFGVAQLVGNGWEWTSTAFAPFQGFTPDPRYPGYSVPFFDEHHRVLKGASCLTGIPLIRRAFRNWFRRDYVYHYATFRVVEP